MSKDKSADYLNDIFSKFLGGPNPALKSTWPVKVCPVCNAKNRIKPGGQYPRCGRCKTNLF